MTTPTKKTATPCFEPHHLPCRCGSYTWALVRGEIGVAQVIRASCAKCGQFKGYRPCEVMSMNEKTVKCPICGRPYKFYAMTVADQSACPACVAEAERATKRPDTAEERRRRYDHFNR